MKPLHSRGPVYSFLINTAVAGVLFFAAAPGHTEPVQAVSTTSMVTDLVQAIGGERVRVDGLMGAGVDPHLYKPTASDVSRLQKAQIIFYSGLHLEGRMAELFERLGKMGRKVYAVTGAIPQGELLKPAEFEGNFDPHVWGDAKLWAHCIPVVVKALSEVDPAGKPYFISRADVYRGELEKLHQWAQQRVQQLQAERRILITSHDAFNYFGRAYGFQVVGVQGISTVTEAGLADVAKVVDFIREKSVPAIFVESSVPRATIERISKDSGAKVGGELFSDAMGAPGTMKTVNGETYDEGTYIGMLKHNVNTTVEGLK